MQVTAVVVGLVMLALAGAVLASRLRTPAPSLLVLAGLAIGSIPGVPAVHVPPELITLGVLPPLLFAAAQQVSLIDLRAVWRLVGVLAVGLVAVTAAVVAAVAHLVVPTIGVAVAFTLGAILASTDPVAVTALSRQLRLPARVATLVQSESLFNDATSLVLFQVAVVAAVAGGMHPGEATLRFVQLAGGGVVLGLLVGTVAAWLMRRASEPTLQAALALLTPYAVAVAAEALHLSSVTAVIVSGLVLARPRAGARQPSGRLVASGMYDVVVFLLENAIFAVIGLELATFVRELPSHDAVLAGELLLAVTATLLLVRGLALAAGVLLWRVPRVRRRSGTVGQPWQVAVVITWAGARGVIPLAAALSIPLTTETGAPFPQRPLLLVVAAGVVVVTLVVQGTTLAPLVRRLGVASDPSLAVEETRRARYSMAQAALDRLDELADSEECSEGAAEPVRHDLQLQLESAKQGRRAATVGSPEERLRLRRRVLDIQTEELARLRSAGEISSEVFRRLQHQLDLEEAHLRG